MPTFVITRVIMTTLGFWPISLSICLHRRRNLVLCSASASVVLFSSSLIIAGRGCRVHRRLLLWHVDIVRVRWVVVGTSSSFCCLRRWNTEGEQMWQIQWWVLHAEYEATLLFFFNSLWPSDVIWGHRYWSILAQVMACCLTAPSHYLNQCWLIISMHPWRLSKGNFPRDTPAVNLENQLQFASIKFLSNLPGANELTHWPWETQMKYQKFNMNSFCYW